MPTAKHSLINQATLQAGGGARHTRRRAFGDIARIAKSTGHDFLFIGAAFAVQSQDIGHIVSTAIVRGIAGARARHRDPDVSLLLDNGAMGLSAGHQHGGRRSGRSTITGAPSAALGQRQLSHSTIARSAADAAFRSSTKLTAGLLDRDSEGAWRTSSHRCCEGIDVLHVGSNDLLANMGKPGVQRSALYQAISSGTCSVRGNASRPSRRRRTIR
jgi:2-keto-3-deoxy-L-rhamnonate aldolase RhmA